MKEFFTKLLRSLRNLWRPIKTLSTPFYWCLKWKGHIGIVTARSVGGPSPGDALHYSLPFIPFRWTHPYFYLFTWYTLFLFTLMVFNKSWVLACESFNKILSNFVPYSRGFVVYVIMLSIHVIWYFLSNREYKSAVLIYCPSCVFMLNNSLESINFPILS